MSNDSAKPFVRKDSALVAASKELFAGTFGGVGTCLVGHPLDTIKVRLQTQSTSQPVYSGAVDCFRKTLQWEGPAGLYKGVMSPLAGQMFFNAIQFFTYGTFRDFFVRMSRQNHGAEGAEGAEGANSNDGTEGASAAVKASQMAKDGPRWVYFAAGALTGVAVSFAEGPVDLLKSQLQVQIVRQKQVTPGTTPTPPPFHGVLSCGRYIYTRHGIPGIYQGFFATQLRNIPAVSLYFGTYESVRLALLQDGQALKDLPASHVMAAGAAGGFLFWFATFPLDNIKTAIQTDEINPSKRRYDSILDATAQLYREGGIARFYRGYGPALARSIPANAACFILYERVRAYLDTI